MVWGVGFVFFWVFFGDFAREGMGIRMGMLTSGFGSPGS